MSDPVVEFYDEMADLYHLEIPRWEEHVLREGELLAQFLRSVSVEPYHTVLDCGCGVGLQSIGLAVQGYGVHAVDISPAMLARVRRNASAFGVALLAYEEADFRSLDTIARGDFDVVLCANALEHVPPDDLLPSFLSMRTKVRSGGLLLVPTRDYDQIARERLPTGPTKVLDLPQGKRFLFRVRDWGGDGRSFIQHLFTVQQSRDRWHTTHLSVPVYLHAKSHLQAMAAAAGFSDMRWHTPPNIAYYFPIMTARA